MYEPGLYLDGRPASALPLPDRAVAFGDGLFETMLFRGRRPAWPWLHDERLRRGLGQLGIPEPPWRDYLQQSLDHLAPAAESWLVVRVTVSRGAGPRGYAPPAESSPRTLVEIGPAPVDPLATPSPLRTATARLRWSRQPALAGLKHLNRLEQVLAASECRERGLDELVVCDSSGTVISTIAGNLFLVADGQLLTPALVESGINGTRRQLLLSTLLPALGLDCREGVVTLPGLDAADAVFSCNSLRGLVPLQSHGRRQWRDHPVIDRLQQAYRAALISCVA